MGTRPDRRLRGPTATCRGDLGRELLPARWAAMNATLNAQGRLRPTPEKRGNFFPGPAESPAGRPKEDVGMCVLSCKSAPCAHAGGSKASAGSVAGTSSGRGGCLSLSYAGVTWPFKGAGCTRHPDTRLGLC